jgi:hypothetical protein
MGGSGTTRADRHDFRSHPLEPAFDSASPPAHGSPFLLPRHEKTTHRPGRHRRPRPFLRRARGGPLLRQQRAGRPVRSQPDAPGLLQRAAGQAVVPPRGAHLPGGPVLPDDRGTAPGPGHHLHDRPHPRRLHRPLARGRLRCHHGETDDDRRGVLPPDHGRHPAHGAPGPGGLQLPLGHLPHQGEGGAGRGPHRPRQVGDS